LLQPPLLCVQMTGITTSNFCYAHKPKKLPLSNSNYYSDTMIPIHTRNRKRPTFSTLVQWLELPQNANIPSHVYTDDKSQYIQRALDHFEHNNSKGQLSDILAEHKKHEEAKAKFNGTLVSEITGLEGKELGNFMSIFAKQWHTKEEAKAWALASDPSQIRQAIEDFHSQNTDIDI
jgi:hypothetical protein